MSFNSTHAKHTYETKQVIKIRRLYLNFCRCWHPARRNTCHFTDPSSFPNAAVLGNVIDDPLINSPFLPSVFHSIPNLNQSYHTPYNKIKPILQHYDPSSFVPTNSFTADLLCLSPLLPLSSWPFTDTQCSMIFLNVCMPTWFLKCIDHSLMPSRYYLYVYIKPPDLLFTDNLLCCSPLLPHLRGALAVWCIAETWSWPQLLSFSIHLSFCGMMIAVLCILVWCSSCFRFFLISYPHCVTLCLVLDINSF